MGFPLPKKGICYQQVIGQREAQDILPLLIPTTIPKASVYPLEPYISRTHMDIKVPSYEEFLTDRYSTNHAIQILPNCLLVLSLRPTWGDIGTNQI